MTTPLRPCAGVQGTTISATDLFFNINIRKNALNKNKNEEMAKCLEVVQHYALQVR